MTTEIMLSIWRMGRIRLTNQLSNLVAGDLRKKIHPDGNSVGWLLRHMAEVEFLFARNIFGEPLEVDLHTVGPGIRDTGSFTNLAELLKFLDDSGRAFELAINHQADDSWASILSTQLFGDISKAEALSRITTHTAWHAGQLAMVKKYVAG